MAIGLPAVRCRNNEYLNPEWVDPHDWTIDRDPLDKLCPQTQACKPCENTAKSEYLRLVNSLFNPSEFRVSCTVQTSDPFSIDFKDFFLMLNCQIYF